ncbi:ABC transporter permease [Calditerrivibrio nitroreducens]|uniref:Nucleoside ABC transporter membrane protein n=1 Tax=Calditerrivibrio nitroreducens (strain DSM 19672 / NBRC 101217 / Yu37-1) TaxID=768670 RepID=E4TJC7_CALNY|nr:ABC transporter permease [Calditerrivibrio nitroreducens]ADR19194.1 nucleoside ABC transporter membrane protein [Calditerrivibrio nitroreducens DSM 19672]
MLDIIIDTTIRAGTPILYATIGAIIMEKSGIINLGIEGLMLIGALSGFYFTFITNSLFIGFIAAVILSSLAGAIHGILTTYLKANQIVSGLALTMFGTGITALLGKSMVGENIRGLERINIFKDIPLLSPILNQDIMVYLSILLLLLIHFFLYRTTIGLNLRTVGENPYTADNAGINVHLYRLSAVVVGSGIVGLGGAYLSLVYTPLWIENMSAGRGWIAVALVIFSNWDVRKAIIGSYLFGGIAANQLRLQAMGTNIPVQILQSLPYIFTILVLIISSLKNDSSKQNQPESLGNPYDREDRV